MNFGEFWRELLGEIADPTTFRTCRYGEPFKAVMAPDSRTVFATPGSGHRRRIPKDDFKMMWNAMKGWPRSERCARARRVCHAACHHTSYICPLIGYVVGNLEMR